MLNTHFRVKLSRLLVFCNSLKTETSLVNSFKVMWKTVVKNKRFNLKHIFRGESETVIHLMGIDDL